LTSQIPESNASNQAGQKLDRLVDLCLDVLSAKPSALATDIDGTISAIAETPLQATVEPAARAALQLLSERLDLVAVITGRAAEEAQQMLDLPDVLYIGNHGLERRWRGETREHSAAVENTRAVLDALAFIEREIVSLGSADGVLLENKRLTASVHYRLAPTRELIGPELSSIVGAAASLHGLKMTEGRYVFELRPPIAINKGTALFDLVEDNSLKGIVFLGDDVTDVDAFRVVREATANGIVQGLAIAVDSPETRSVVVNEADEMVVGVDGAVKLLSQLGERVRTSSDLLDGAEISNG
jgi:trehalose 6-phosphate phosphatase